jgi:hypothetical protein
MSGRDTRSRTKAKSSTRANVPTGPAKTQAPAQYLGYSLQCTRLVELLLQASPGSIVTLEVFEDVGLQSPDGQIRASQTKSALATNPISDHAAELWKALCNWINAINSGLLPLQQTSFEIYVSTPRPANIAKLFSEAKTAEEARQALAAARQILFSPGRLNVISGASRTGKSAIIPIIDYCLGADRCTIPVKTIRDHTEWFGILIDTPQGQKLLARREPGQQKATGNMYILEGKQVEVPERITARNAMVDAVKRSLDQLAGLTSLDLNPQAESVGFQSRPSFRDLGAFLFQPQNVVANPNVLFYKADTVEHREKLRNIFPYVLGAVTPEILVKRHECAELRKELRRKEQELRTVREVSERWLAEIQAHVARARELGLTHTTEGPLTQSQALEVLRSVVHTSIVSIGTTAGTITEAVAELTRLEQEEATISRDLSKLRRRFAEMSQLRNNVQAFRDALRVQHDRLQVADWLKSHSHNEHDCPVCGHQISADNPKLNN